MTDFEGIGAFPIPTSPYPGLRPFLDHEAALFLGRVRQIDDVVRRLNLNQFVTVIGGSGSGKSSLVRAGVVPELRAFGIPNAGDYWLPIVFTPGSTAMLAAGEGIGEADTPANQTPITRLAWKFSQQLEPAELPARRRLLKAYKVAEANNLDSERESVRRQDEIATVFRQGAGFARLIEAYTEDLPESGPDRENARFLFVIDQFEELFHPNNKGNEDTRILIEAVIDHFFSPHPRCFVILTMRSEHLADCAGYLELPDAINESVYLVRRPDEGELREAVAGPAKVFLRMLQRGDGGATLPDDLRFDDAVVERLLRDVERIADDPDHLPLLQHLLARIWEVACTRCGFDGEHGVPSDIQWSDLERGADPKSRETGWLHQRDEVNTLRASLENWARATYEDKSEEDRKHIDFVLRRLAFKDPNNGTYYQQRLDVTDPGLFAGDADRQDKLRDLFEQGYLDAVHYLYWDKENPARVTLKVSHESFIRGWSYFRGLVDMEAERFEDFLTVLRRCADWQEAIRRPELLLGQAELNRLDDAGLGPVFTEQKQHEDWFRTLKQFRHGDWLVNVESEVADYIASSRAFLEREKQAEWRREAEANQRTEEFQRLRRKRWIISLAFVVLIFGAIPFVAVFPVMSAIDKFGMARQRVDQRLAEVPEPVLGAADKELNRLLAAADLVVSGKVDTAYLRGHLGNLFSWLPQVALANRLLVRQDTESYVNGNLRRRLTTGIWNSATDLDAKVFKQEMFVPDNPMRLSCDIDQAGNRKAVTGVLYPDSSAGRGIFIPARLWEDNDIELFSARYSKQYRTCETVDLISQVPNSTDSFVLFDARVRYMLVSQSGSHGEPPSVNLFNINWDEDAKLPVARSELLSKTIGEDAIAIVHQEFQAGPRQDGDPRVRSVLAWREAGGIGVRVSGRSWRLFADGAQRIQEPGNDKDWRPLLPATQDAACGQLNERMIKHGVTQGFESRMYQYGSHCFLVQRPVPPTDDVRFPERTGPNYTTVGVYDALIAIDLLVESRPAPIASISPFANARWADGEWMVGVSGPYDGWLVVRLKSDQGDRVVGAPWSTAALFRLGKEAVSPSHLE